MEALRKADWLDVFFGLVRFGIDPAWHRAVRQASPLHTFYPRALLLVIGGDVLRNPISPLPNFKW